GQADYTTTLGYLDATAKIQDARERSQGITDLSKGYGGLGEALKDHYGDSQDQAAFDANLLGASNPDFSAVSSKAASLSDYLDKGAQAAAAKSPPPAQPAPAPQRVPRETPAPRQTPQERFPWKFPDESQF